VHRQFKYYNKCMKCVLFRRTMLHLYVWGRVLLLTAFTRAWRKVLSGCFAKFCTVAVLCCGNGKLCFLDLGLFDARRLIARYVLIALQYNVRNCIAHVLQRFPWVMSSFGSETFQHKSKSTFYEANLSKDW